jgi:hypothetical protein
MREFNLYFSFFSKSSRSRASRQELILQHEKWITLQSFNSETNHFSLILLSANGTRRIIPFLSGKNHPFTCNTEESISFYVERKAIFRKLIVKVIIE